MQTLAQNGRLKNNYTKGHEIRKGEAPDGGAKRGLTTKHTKDTKAGTGRQEIFLSSRRAGQAMGTEETWRSQSREAGGFLAH